MGFHLLLFLSPICPERASHEGSDGMGWGVAENLALRGPGVDRTSGGGPGSES